MIRGILGLLNLSWAVLRDSLMYHIYARHYFEELREIVSGLGIIYTTLVNFMVKLHFRLNNFSKPILYVTYVKIKGNLKVNCIFNPEQQSKAYKDFFFT